MKKAKCLIKNNGKAVDWINNNYWCQLQRDFVSVERLYEIVGGDYGDKQTFNNEAHMFCQNSGEFDYRMFVKHMMSVRVLNNVVPAKTL